MGRSAFQVISGVLNWITLYLCLLGAIRGVTGRFFVLAAIKGRAMHWRGYSAEAGCPSPTYQHSMLCLPVCVMPHFVGITHKSRPDRKGNFGCLRFISNGL